MWVLHVGPTGVPCGALLAVHTMGLRAHVPEAGRPEQDSCPAEVVPGSQGGECLLAMWVLCVSGGPDQGHRALRAEGPPHSSAWTGRRLRNECGWGPWWEELRSSCTWGPCGEAGPSWAPASCQGCSSWDAQPSSQPSLSCHFLDAIKIMGKNFHGVEGHLHGSRAFEVPLWDPKTAFFTETSPRGTGDSGLRVQGCESCAVRRGWMGYVPRSPHHWGTDCPGDQMCSLSG